MLRRHFYCLFFSKWLKFKLGRKLALATSGSATKRFMRKSEPSESLPGPFSVPVSPVPVQRASSKKIALEAPSTSNQVDASAEDLHLIKLGSLQGALSALSCCGSPLTITKDRKNRRGLVSNNPSLVVFVASFLPSLTPTVRRIWR